MTRAKFQFEALGVNLRDRQLTEASLRRYAPSGTKVYAEPTLRGSTTDPSGFGTNVAGHGILRAFYIRNDDRFDMWFSFQAIAGFNPGSGDWLLELPDDIEIATTAVDTMYAGLGTWFVHRPSSGAYQHGLIEGSTADRVAFAYSNAGTKTFLSDSAPWSLANGDRFGGHISLAVV